MARSHCVYVCARRSPSSVQLLGAELYVEPKPWVPAAVDLGRGIYNVLEKPFLLRSPSLTVLYKLLAKVIMLNRGQL